VDPWASFIIGIFAFLVLHVSSLTLIALTIDDPLDATAVHGACGLLGVLAVASFSRKDLLEQQGLLKDEGHFGIFYGGDGGLLGKSLSFGMDGMGEWM